MSDDQLKAVIQLGQERAFEPDEQIYRRGQTAEALYVLLNGCVSLTLKVVGELDPVAEKLEETGRIFGMAALTRSRVYSATAECMTPSTVLVFGSAQLQEIVRSEPIFGLEVMAELTELYLKRLNLMRMETSNLFKILRSQNHKPEILDAYWEG
jgi:CRP-like cAMP-binding protein